WPKKNEVGLSDPSLSCYQENRALARRRPLAKKPSKNLRPLFPRTFFFTLSSSSWGNCPEKTSPQIHVNFVSGVHLIERLLAPYLFWACPFVACGFSGSR
ncbi:hypothetical protein AVEN_49796-1, partial [Araneus ventricosus]